jgi:hypothetical protein
MWHVFRTLRKIVYAFPKGEAVKLHWRWPTRDDFKNILGKARSTRNKYRHIPVLFKPEDGSLSVPKLLVYLAAVVLAITGFAAYYWDPNWRTFVVGVILLPLAALLGALRLARGSLKQAQQIEYDNMTRILSNHNLTVDDDLLPTRLRQALDPGEKVRGQFRRHPIAIFRFYGPIWTSWCFIAPILLFVALYKQVWGFAGIVLVVTGIWFWLIHWEWRKAMLFVSTKNLLALRGIISHATDVLPKVRLTDSMLRIPASSNILAYFRFIWVPYGRVHVESAGQVQGLEMIDYMPNVSQAWRLIKFQEQMAKQPGDGT